MDPVYALKATNHKHQSKYMYKINKQFKLGEFSSLNYKIIRGAFHKSFSCENFLREFNISYQVRHLFFIVYEIKMLDVINYFFII